MELAISADLEGLVSEEYRSWLIVGLWVQGQAFFLESMNAKATIQTRTGFRQTQRVVENDPE